MIFRLMRTTLLAASALGVLLAAALPPAAWAEEVKPAAATKPAEPAIELTAEEKAERESRRACKAAICGALHAGQAPGGDIACTVIKSWRKSQIEKIAAKAHMSWPYGRIRCTSDLHLKHGELAKSLAEDKHLTKLQPHSVKCVIEGKKAEADNEQTGPTTITFEFAPEITFEKGKAVKARLNWGEIEAPKLIKAAMWAAMATDNTLNVLQQTVIADVNDFTGKKCDEVKEDWAGR